MQFENVVQLARDTPKDVLCQIWGDDAGAVEACTKGERPMTIRQVGALAEVHGLTLLDVLSI